jgi:hypothetical protein
MHTYVHGKEHTTKSGVMDPYISRWRGGGVIIKREEPREGCFLPPNTRIMTGMAAKPKNAVPHPTKTKRASVDPTITFH